MSERAGSRRIIIGLILILALGLRCGAALWWESRVPEGQRFAFGDSDSYWILAGQIARGEPYQFGPGEARIFRTPGYPLLLAGLYRLAHGEPPVLAARMLGALLGTLAVGGVICLTTQLFSPRAALLAGLLAAIYPGAIGMSVFVLSEAPFCPLMLGQLIGWVAAWQAASPRRTAGWAFVAGVFAGLATLVRPSWLLFTPFAGGLGVLLYSRRGRHVLIGIGMLIGLMVTMLPWWIRNYEITGKLTLTTTQFGASLYDGWRPDATGDSDMRFVESFYQAQRAADAQAPTQVTGTFEERLDRRLRDAALDWAREHPGQVLRLAGVKFLRIWSPWPNAAEMQSWAYRLAILFGCTPLMVLGVTGMWKFAKRGWPYALCAMPAVYFTCLHMIFVGSIRYRQPGLLVLIVVVAGLMDTLCFPREPVAPGDSSEAGKPNNAAPPT